jgi:hypothetical protein
MSMFLILNIISVYSQQTKIPVDPKRAALGQTKWISNQLKLDESLQSRIYDINLKYQLKMDSIRLTENDIRQKNNIYQLMVMKKDDEFKRVLTPEMYSEYQLMIEALRIKALGYREAIKK